MSSSAEQMQVDKKYSTEDRLKDKTYFRELLGELLDEKFTEYLNPVKKSVSDLEKKVINMEKEYANKIG